MSLFNEKMTIQKNALALAFASRDGFAMRDILEAIDYTSSRQYVHRIVKKMVANGELRAKGSGRARKYITTNLNHIDLKKISLKKLTSEESLWKKISQEEYPWIESLPKRIFDILQFIVTEMVNNVIDHASAKNVSYHFSQEEDYIQGIIQDDGIGVFQKVKKQLNLESHLIAAQKILEGKTTTARDAHSGEGIFFSSKAAGLFTLEANGLSLIVDNYYKKDTTVKNIDENSTEEHVQKKGTAIRFHIFVDDARKLSEIFQAYTNDDTYRFDTTKITVQLYTINTQFVSRSEAKRIMTSLAEKEFDRIIFDYQHVTHIGQGFADEIYRVSKNIWPHITIDSINMNDVVKMMVNHAQASI